MLDAVLGLEAASSESPPPLENDQSPPEPVTAAPSGQEAATPTGVELESMVSHVRDLLPDLSNSFVTVGSEKHSRHSPTNAADVCE